MANTKIISDEIKSRLEFLKTRLNLVAKGNTSKKIYYKIDYCNKNDNDWRVAVKKEEIADFLKDAKNIITRLDADAMQVSFYNYGKIFENEIIRVNNVIIPFLDMPKTQNEAKASTPDQFFPFFERMAEILKQSTGQGDANNLSLQGIQSESQMTILQLKHEMALDKLQTKIEVLTEKQAEKEKYIENLEDLLSERDELIADLQKKVNPSILGLGRQGDVLMATGIGKLLQMKNEEILGLAGLLSGSETPPNANSEELLSPNAETNAIEDKRKTDISIITQWLGEIDDDSFQYICYIIRSVAENPKLYIKLLSILEENNKGTNLQNPTIPNSQINPETSDSEEENTIIE